MQFIKFIFSRLFLLNLLLVGALSIFGFWLTSFMLDTYTRHGESVRVPDLSGMTLEEVEDLLKDKHLYYVVNDSSVFNIDIPPMAVVDQNPKPNNKVKEDRKIYLNINPKTPPKKPLPKLTEMTFEDAQFVLTRSKFFELGELIYVPSDAQNYVFEQQIAGEEVHPGAYFPVGTKIDLVLGDGLGKTKTNIPYLIGLTFEEAKIAIVNSFLTLGSVVIEAEVTDTAAAFVIQQLPGYDEDRQVSLGTSLDLVLSNERPEISLDSLLNEYRGEEAR